MTVFIITMLVITTLALSYILFSALIKYGVFDDTYDNLLISADEARKLIYDEKREISEELKKINKNIVDTAKCGKYSIWCNKYSLHKETIEALKNQGYKIFPNWISWEDYRHIKFKKGEQSNMMKEDMNKMKEDIINRFNRDESTEQLLKDSGIMKLKPYETFEVMANVFADVVNKLEK